MNTHRTAGLVAVLLVVSLAVTLASAAPLETDPVTGHSYDAIIAPGIDWPTADASATAAGGYLASITSFDEDRFVNAVAAAEPGAWQVDYRGGAVDFGPWIGGYEVSEGTWAWTSGEPWSYAPWYSGEPNDYYGEKYVQLVAVDYLANWATWNDAGGADTLVTNGYIVEYDPPRAVPPSTLPPTDPGRDGLFEDVNGNGRADFADVVLYFNQMSWIGGNEPVSAFDYNGNGRIDFADVVWLFNHL